MGLYLQEETEDSSSSYTEEESEEKPVTEPEETDTRVHEIDENVISITAGDMFSSMYADEGQDRKMKAQKSGQVSNARPQAQKQQIMRTNDGGLDSPFSEEDESSQDDRAQAKNKNGIASVKAVGVKTQSSDRKFKHKPNQSSQKLNIVQPNPDWWDATPTAATANRYRDKVINNV